MRKIINDPNDFVDEMLEDILTAHPEQLKNKGNGLRCIIRSDDKKPGKVAISTDRAAGPLLLEGFNSYLNNI